MKTLILTHADCDGICAGAVALSMFPDSRVFFTKPVSIYSDLKEARGFKRILILDIALNKKEAPVVAETLKKLSKDSEVLYFDHHPLPKSMTEDSLRKSVKLLVRGDASTSELVYRHYQKSMPRERVWPALYGAIADYSAGTEFVKERLRNWDSRAIYFEVSALALGIKTEMFATYDAKRRITRTLAAGKNPSDIKGLVGAAKEAVSREFELYELVKKEAKVLGGIAYVKDVPTFGFRGPSALFAATVRNRPIGLSIHSKRDFLDVTARARDPAIRLNLLMEKASESVGGTGGGHPQAAGARIPKDSLERFLETINKN